MWFTRRLGNVEQIGILYLNWRKQIAHSIRYGSSYYKAQAQTQYRQAVSAWVKDTERQSEAMDWCFMFYPYNGGTGNRPVACWRHEVSLDLSHWLRDARALQLAAKRLRIALILPRVPG